MDVSFSQRKPTVKIYFENLNAIRFIAAALVIVHHIEQFKSQLHVPNQWDNSIILSIGKLGVILFFVLSGFLISYLLFKEQEVTSTISIKDFYIRRALRIWPLYFLVIFSAFFVFPFISFFTLTAFPKEIVWQNLEWKLVLYAFFLPNVVIPTFGVIPYASQAWSIGAEEQFYLVWPGLNKLIKNKWALMLSVIAGYLLVKFGVYHVLPAGRILDAFSTIWWSTPIDCMAIGGLFAVALNESSEFAVAIKRVLFSKTCQWLLLLITAALTASSLYIPYFHYEVFAVLFGGLICSFAANPQRIFSMENAWTNQLGKISYGLYMYHSIAIVFSIRILLKTGSLHDVILYPIAFALTALIATLSYTFFEKPFIDKKAKYSKLISGDSAKERVVV